MPGEMDTMLIAESENFSSTSAILDSLKKKPKNKDFSDIRFTEDDFKNGISFDAKVSQVDKACSSLQYSIFIGFLKYIGSLDVAKPNSRVEIVAAMRRIRVSIMKRFSRMYNSLV
jgi:hypothetical protein